MGLKVIGAGFGRTGTLSLKQALEQLGYTKTHHMLEVMPREAQVRYWLDAGQGMPVDWDAVFDGFQASVDFPSASFYEDLLVHYPDAKVILTTRDFDRWYESALGTIYALTYSVPMWLVRLVPPMRRRFDMSLVTVWNRVFDGRFTDKDHTRKVFENHIRQVQSKVPAEQLFVFEVKQGWEPLCAFLDKPVPEGPFPHANDTASFKKAIRIIKLGLAGFHGLIAGVILFALYKLLN